MEQINMLTLFFILLGILKMDVSAFPIIEMISIEPPEFMESAKIVNDEIQLSVHMKSVVIQCSAPYPITWTFSGVTAPMQLNVRAYRKSSQDNLNNSTFQAQLQMYRVSAQLTGEYVCSSISNANKKASLFIFGSTHQYRGKDPVLLRHGTTVNITLPDDSAQTQVHLPCASWDVAQLVLLYKRSEKGHFEELKTKSGESVRFNPKVGFVLNTQDFDDITGKYMCTPDPDLTFDRMYINVFSRPDFEASPSEYLVEGLSGATAQFTCKAMEKVKWIVNNGMTIREMGDPRIRVTEEHNPSALHPYISHFEYFDLSVMDDVEIECVGEKSGRVLHSWRYQVIAELDSRRRGWKRFVAKSSNTETFACWAKSSYSPFVSFVSCLNPMECQIRGQCLQNENKCDTINARICPGGCTLISIVNQTGVLQCRGDGIFQQLHQFTGVSGRSFLNISDMGSEEILQVEGPSEVSFGNVEEFTCTGSAFLFAQGFRWSIQQGVASHPILSSDNAEILIKESSSVLSSGLIQSTARIRIKGATISQVMCHAPYWNSVKWEHRAFPIRFEGSRQNGRRARIEYAMQP